MSTLSVASSLSNSSLAAHQPPSNLIPAAHGGPRRERSGTSLAAQYRRHRPSDDSTPLHVACMQRDARTACARIAMSREAPEAFTGWSLMASCGNRRLLPVGSRRAAGLLGRIREAVYDGVCSPVAMLHLMASPRVRYPQVRELARGISTVPLGDLSDVDETCQSSGHWLCKLVNRVGFPKRAWQDLRLGGEARMAGSWYKALDACTL